MREVIVDGGHVQVFLDGELVGEGGVCREYGCSCIGIWVYWGDGFSASEVNNAD